MRERLEAATSGPGALSLSGPVTRSREQGLRHQAFGVMESEPAPLEPSSETQAARVLVSDPMQRNIEAARE